MPFTHHSHSGQFCNHAKNSLEEMVDTAIKKKMTVFSMTEHVPRGNKHLYPGELEAGEDEVYQRKLFPRFVEEATRLRAEKEVLQHGSDMQDQFQILIGFENEWVARDESYAITQDVQAIHQFDFFVGSVHHVDTVPIDFSKEYYDLARAGASEDVLCMKYFDSQRQMLLQTKPRVVGHFDLIRLYSDNPDLDWRSRDPEIWRSIVTNLEIIKAYGGVLEMNSSALRKGLSEPYPRSEICKAFMNMGGDFVLSDDSHAVDHVGTNYSRMLDFIRTIGLQHIAYLFRQDGEVVVKKMTLSELELHPFWTS